MRIAISIRPQWVLLDYPEKFDSGYPILLAARYRELGSPPG